MSSASTDETDKDRYARLDRPRFVCPHCRAFAQQSWTDLVMPSYDGPWEYLETQQIESTSFDYPTTVSRWKGAQCGSCHKWNVWHDQSMVYPPFQVGPPPHRDMPEGARELYEEASRVAHVSLRAGAAMARAAIERLIKDIDPDAPARAKLDDRIVRLRGQVSTSLGQLLDVVRVTGNSALHRDDHPSEIVVLALDDKEGPATLGVLLQAANDMVDELITKPRTAESLWNMLPESVRRRTERGT